MASVPPKSTTPPPQTPSTPQTGLVGGANDQIPPQNTKKNFKHVRVGSKSISSGNGSNNGSRIDSGNNKTEPKKEPAPKNILLSAAGSNNQSNSNTNDDSKSGDVTVTLKQKGSRDAEHIIFDLNRDEFVNQFCKSTGASREEIDSGKFISNKESYGDDKKAQADLLQDVLSIKSEELEAGLSKMSEKLRDVAGIDVKKLRLFTVPNNVNETDQLFRQLATWIHDLKSEGATDKELKKAVEESLNIMAEYTHVEKGKGNKALRCDWKSALAAPVVEAAMNAIVNLPFLLREAIFSKDVGGDGVNKDMVVNTYAGLLFTACLAGKGLTFGKVAPDWVKQQEPMSNSTCRDLIATCLKSTNAALQFAGGLTLTKAWFENDDSGLAFGTGILAMAATAKLLEACVTGGGHQAQIKNLSNKKPQAVLQKYVDNLKTDVDKNACMKASNGLSKWLCKNIVELAFAPSTVLGAYAASNAAAADPWGGLSDHKFLEGTDDEMKATALSAAVCAFVGSQVCCALLAGNARDAALRAKAETVDLEDILGTKADGGGNVNKNSGNNSNDIDAATAAFWPNNKTDVNSGGDIELQESKKDAADNTNTQVSNGSFGDVGLIRGDKDSHNSNELGGNDPAAAPLTRTVEENNDVNIGSNQSPANAKKTTQGSGATEYTAVPMADADADNSDA